MSAFFQVKSWANANQQQNASNKSWFGNADAHLFALSAMFVIDEM